MFKSCQLLGKSAIKFILLQQCVTFVQKVKIYIHLPSSASACPCTQTEAPLYKLHYSEDSLTHSSLQQQASYRLYLILLTTII